MPLPRVLRMTYIYQHLSRVRPSSTDARMCVRCVALKLNLTTMFLKTVLTCSNQTKWHRAIKICSLSQDTAHAYPRKTLTKV